VKRKQHRVAWLIAFLALSACGGRTVAPTQTGPASMGGISADITSLASDGPCLRSMAEPAVS